MTYISIVDSLKANGDRHKQNAELYLCAGNLHHAIGSYRKMLRNYEAALKLESLMDEKFNDLCNVLAKHVANQILNGE